MPAQAATGDEALPQPGYNLSSVKPFDLSPGQARYPGIHQQANLRSAGGWRVERRQRRRCTDPVRRSVPALLLT